MNQQTDDPNPAKPGASLDWRLRPPINVWTVLACFVLVAILAFSAHNTEMDRAVKMTGEGILHGVGIQEESEVGNGASRFFTNGSEKDSDKTGFFKKVFNLQLSDRTEIERVADFDPENLPFLSYIESEPIREYDIDEEKFVVTGEQEYLVKPLGYIVFIFWKMIETLEIALWGTILAIVLSVPLALISASNYSPHPGLYYLGRGLCSLVRAIPDLILAMFLVLMYGFGPIAGVFALAIHTSGFLGKFFADDIENCDRGPQEALESTGASKLKILRISVLPQIFPQCFSYVQYILERNVRMATVLGIVGAGGIGIELKGRWDMFDYGHVKTILLAIFIAVVLLELATQMIRKKVMD